MTDQPKPASFSIWLAGVFLAAIVARLGWEIGGKLWALF